jgi:hypothetical protein
MPDESAVGILGEQLPRAVTEKLMNADLHLKRVGGVLFIGQPQGPAICGIGRSQPPVFNLSHTPDLIVGLAQKSAVS